jgi:hypothetical protein
MLSKHTAVVRKKLLQIAEKLEQHIAMKQRQRDLPRTDAPEDADRSMADRRRTRRLRMDTPARVILNGWLLEVPCLISDLSSMGARLKLPCVLTLPDTFHVVTIGSQTTFLATKVWQKGVEVGVRFTDVRLRPV